MTYEDDEKTVELTRIKPEDNAQAVGIKKRHKAREDNEITKA